MIQSSFHRENIYNINATQINNNEQHLPNGSRQRLYRAFNLNGNNNTRINNDRRL